MSYDLIQTATVICYPYLWARQANTGETEGRKQRPVAVGVRLKRPNGDLVVFFPITTKQPEPSRFSAEIPAIEKRRAGLDQDLRLWIILDELRHHRPHVLPRARSSDWPLQQGILPATAARFHCSPELLH